MYIFFLAPTHRKYIHGLREHMIIVGTNLTRIMLMTMKAYQLTCDVTGLSTCVRHSDMGRHLPVSSQNSSRMSLIGTVGAGSRVQVGGKVLDLGIESAICLEQ